MAAGEVAPAAEGHGACLLAGAVGRSEAGPPCPFWEGDAGSAGCVVEQLSLQRTLELRRRRDLAEWLLELRKNLVSERTS